MPAGLESELKSSTICYMITAIVKPDGTALGYFVFVPKVHMLNVMINVNARIGIAHDLSQPSAGHYVCHSALALACPVCRY